MLHRMMTIKADEQTYDTSLPLPPSAMPAWARCLLVCFGWLMVVIGLIGVVVPVLPTTVFLIIALWAFSRSSRKFQLWVWNHRTFGPPIRDWHRHGVIPVRAKVMAVMLMTLSFMFVTIWVAQDWRLPTILSVIMLPAALYIVTRRSNAPEQPDPFS